MKWTSPAAVALVAVMVASAHARIPSVERVCEPNTSWKRDCNDCVCTEDLKAVCTKRDCSATEACRPGDTWRQGCNTCSCTGSGAVCTQMACLGDGPHEPKSPVAEPMPLPSWPGMAAICRPGQVWKQDCNTCRCARGRALCTQMACPGTSTTSSPLPDGYECRPGDTWMQECNTCRCSSAGVAVCTLMGCGSSRLRREASAESSSSSSSEELAGGLCKPGSSWKKDCNTCFCNVGGVPTCTKILCIKPFQAVSEPQPQGQGPAPAPAGPTPNHPQPHQPFGSVPVAPTLSQPEPSNTPSTP